MVGVFMHRKDLLCFVVLKQRRMWLERSSAVQSEGVTLFSPGLPTATVIFVLLAVRRTSSTSLAPARHDLVRRTLVFLFTRCVCYTVNMGCNGRRNRCSDYCSNGCCNGCSKGCCNSCSNSCSNGCNKLSDD